MLQQSEEEKFDFSKFDFSKLQVDKGAIAFLQTDESFYIVPSCLNGPTVFKESDFDYNETDNIGIKQDRLGRGVRENPIIAHNLGENYSMFKGDVEVEDIDLDNERVYRLGGIPLSPLKDNIHRFMVELYDYFSKNCNNGGINLIYTSKDEYKDEYKEEYKEEDDEEYDVKLPIEISPDSADFIIDLLEDIYEYNGNDQTINSLPGQLELEDYENKTKTNMDLRRQLDEERAALQEERSILQQERAALQEERSRLKEQQTMLKEDKNCDEEVEKANQDCDDKLKKLQEKEENLRLEAKRDCDEKARVAAANLKKAQLAAAEAENAKKDCDDRIMKLQEEENARLLLEQEKANDLAMEKEEQEYLEEQKRIDDANIAKARAEKEAADAAAAASKARLAEAEEESRLATEELERARLATEKARIKAEEEESRLAAEDARIKSEEEDKARIKAEEEEARLKEQEEKERIEAEKQKARIKAEEEEARLKEQEEKERIEAEKQKARIKAEEETRKLEEEQERIEAEGFTGTKGAVKPRSSLDVTDLRSVKSTDDEKQKAILEATPAKIDLKSIIERDKLEISRLLAELRTGLIPYEKINEITLKAWEKQSENNFFVNKLTTIKTLLKTTLLSDADTKNKEEIESIIDNMDNAVKIKKLIDEINKYFESKDNIIKEVDSYRKKITVQARRGLLNTGIFVGNMLKSFKNYNKFLDTINEYEKFKLEYEELKKNLDAESITYVDSLLRPIDEKMENMSDITEKLATKKDDPILKDYLEDDGHIKIGPKVGDKVQCKKVKGGKLYDCTITKNWHDETYDIKYDDGTTAEKINIKDIKQSDDTLNTGLIKLKTGNFPDGFYGFNKTNLKDNDERAFYELAHIFLGPEPSRNIGVNTKKRPSQGKKGGTQKTNNIKRNITQKSHKKRTSQRVFRKLKTNISRKVLS